MPPPHTHCAAPHRSHKSLHPVTNPTASALCLLLALLDARAALQTVNTGSLRWGTINLMAYFYMVLSWGGYSFVINLIPIYVLACIVTGRVTARHYLAFAPLVFVGTTLAGG